MLPITNLSSQNQTTLFSDSKQQLPQIHEEMPNLNKNMVGNREKPQWINDLLGVLYEAWSDGVEFKNLVLQAI